MNDSREELIQLLIDKATSNERLEFTFLRSIEELIGARLIRNAHKTIAKQFNDSANKVFKDYLKLIKTQDYQNKESLEKLSAYVAIKNLAVFYESGAAVLTDMIKEYKCYLRWGHFFKSAVLGQLRPEEELVDWRKLPISFW